MKIEDKFDQVSTTANPLRQLNWRRLADLMVKFTDANVRDNQIGIELLTDVFNPYVTIQFVCSDAAYREEFEDWLYFAHQRQREIASTLGQQRFEVIRHNG